MARASGLLRQQATARHTRTSEAQTHVSVRRMHSSNGSGTKSGREGEAYIMVLVQWETLHRRAVAFRHPASTLNQENLKTSHELRLGPRTFGLPRRTQD